MTNDQLEVLKKAALAATPQNLDSAEIVENPQTGEKFLECPCCGGEGSVKLHADYCNYDGHALGVQFYGIGPEHLAAEAYFRAASPATILALIERVGRAERASTLLEQIIDIYDDGTNNAPEHRWYVEGAWSEVLAEARASIAAKENTDE